MLTQSGNISVWRGLDTPPTIYHKWIKEDLNGNYIGEFVYRNGEWTNNLKEVHEILDDVVRFDENNNVPLRENTVILGTTSIGEQKELIGIQENNFVKIGNIYWAKENLSVGGIVINNLHYYTFDEAQEWAEKEGMRCPTSEEFQELTDIGSTWDDELKGRWFGEDHNLKTESTKSIFFPTSGWYDSGLKKIGFHGYYWSATPEGVANARNLYFYNGTVFPQDTNSKVSGFAVRCVMNILDDKIKVGDISTDLVLNTIDNIKVQTSIGEEQVAYISDINSIIIDGGEY